MVYANKYPINADIFKNRSFKDLTLSQQRYALSSWNHARVKKGLRPVWPPERLIPTWGGGGR